MMYWVNNVEYPTNAAAKFGARAILKFGVVDILTDRMDFEVESNAAGNELGEWLQRGANLWLREKAKRINVSENALHSWDCGKFHIRCNAQASYGYLYIAAWMDKEK